MVKHAGIVPQCAIAFEKLLIEAGAPAGLYTNLLISHEQSDQVVDDPRIKGVALTGSVAAGRSIAARAGQEPQDLLDGARRQRRLHRAGGRRPRPTDQMGGLGPDVQHRPDLLRRQALHRRRTDRRQVPGEVPGGARRAEGRAIRWTRRRRSGPLSTRSGAGGTAEAGRWRRRQGRQGASWAASASTVRARSWQPTILTDIKPDNPAFRDEFFGPVAMFFRVKDEDEAIALANDSDFGLGGSVFTKDVARGKRVASRVETGMMFINNIDWSDAELPFGGIKNSGYGRELGDMGIQEFVNKKLVRTSSAEAPV